MDNIIKNKLHEEMKTNIDEWNFLKEKRAFIAGGALTSIICDNKINDFDIYFKTEKECNEAIDYFTNDFEFECIATTDNAVTFEKEGLFKTTIQLIRAKDLINECIYDTISRFDFTINMAAYDLLDDRVIAHKDFYIDNIKRKLIYNENTMYPIVSFHRALKYINRGYKLSGYEQVKIALAINNVKMKDYNDLKKQLQGIDTSIFKPITDKLMEQPQVEYNYDEFKNQLNINNDELF